jgi:hypothetical protein
MVICETTMSKNHFYKSSLLIKPRPKKMNEPESHYRAYTRK